MQIDPQYMKLQIYQIPKLIAIDLFLTFRHLRYESISKNYFTIKTKLWGNKLIINKAKVEEKDLRIVTQNKYKNILYNKYTFCTFEDEHTYE